MMNNIKYNLEENKKRREKTRVRDRFKRTTDKARLQTGGSDQIIKQKWKANNNKKNNQK